MLTAVILMVILIPTLVVGTYPLWITRLLARSRDRSCPGGRCGSPPAVSVIVPYHGLDAHLAQNAEAVLGQAFSTPAEVLWCVESVDDPVVPVLEALSSARSAATARLVVTGSACGALGKMHNLLGGLAEARGERLVFLDSDVCLPDPHYLERLLGGLDRPGVGLVTCFPAYRDARNVPAAFITSTINNDLLGLFAVVAAFGPLSVANGSCLAIDRSVLRIAGGLAPLRHQLLMDSALAERVLDAGYDVWLHDQGAPIHAGHASWSEVRAQTRRWHVAMSRVLPLPTYLGFAWLRSGVLLGTIAFTVTGGHPAIGLGLLVSLTVRVVIAFWLDRSHLHSRTLGRYLWLLPLIEWINGWDALTAPLMPAVSWGGKEYRVDRRGRATETAPVRGRRVETGP